MVVGSLIATIFGLIFIEVNSGGLPSDWPSGIRIAGAVAAAGLLLAILRTSRLAGAQTPRDNAGFADPRYLAILGIEAVALFGGLAVINLVLGRPALAVPWIALVVGVHFFGLARLWHLSSFLTLGVALVILGGAGFLLSALSFSTGAVNLVSGAGSGAALFIAAGAAVVKAN
jgi:hypothetical protein